MEGIMMSKFSITIADKASYDFWDSYVLKSPNGTLYHEQKFLSYHGDKFKDRTVNIIIRDGDKVAALVSFLVDGTTIRSPYGASYGGFVFTHPPTYSHSVAILSLVMDYLSKEYAAEKITLSPPPNFCASASNDTFLFAMTEAGFILSSRDICSVVDLRGLKNSNDTITNNAQNMIRKAHKNGVEIMEQCTVQQFWELLTDTYKKHGVPPTHSYSELSVLHDLYPDRISFHGVAHEGVPVAAICEFSLNTIVKTSFYFGQNEEKKEFQGLSLAIEHALARAIRDGYSYYDFGTSTVNMAARPNIFRFKESFGAQGFFREKYEWRK
jgi:hypothetical protein